MNVQWKNGVLKITGVAIDVRLCLIDSAQSFVWREQDGAFYAVLFDAPLCVKPIEGGLTLHPVNELEIDAYLHYFDLARDYGALRCEYAMHPRAVESMEAAPGLRILNQPVWETLISFILSANNNMARIRKLAWLLSEHYGKPHAIGNLVLRGMPGPDVLRKVPEQALRDMGFGYRAPFLVRTAQMVADGFPLGKLSEMPYEQAHAELIRLPGVGDKVADCVLLFGSGHASAFPVDVWVERVCRCWLPELSAIESRLKLQRAARALLGGHAGLIQQFLFHCARCALLPLESE